MNFVKNEIYAVKNDCISFSIYHESSGRQVELDENEKYLLKVKKNLNIDEAALEFFSDSSDFCFDCPELDCGEYYFEISVVDQVGVPRVILPAVDNQGNCLNKLIIIERL